MSKIEVDQITQQSGTTLTVGGGACKTAVVDATTVTLGRTGATVSLAPGASQSGFGRTGTVDWCTTAKTSPFTAVSGDGFFVNTTSGAITVTLPASPSAGDIVAFKDYANTWDTNNVTICRNSSKINGQCANATLSTEAQSVTLIYVDGTKGWQDIHDSTSNVTGASFVAATGGTVTTSGNFKIHTFTSDSSFVVSSAGNPTGSTKVDYLVIAGGGTGRYFGGGGAGGYRESHCSSVSGPYTASPLASSSSIPVSVQSYPITVGAGGSEPAGTDGSNSVFDSITSAGGGKGANSSSDVAGNGGSGGGGSYGPNSSGGTGNTPPVSPPQGNNGGNGFNGGAWNESGGGGGSAGAVGANATTGVGGAGGAGTTSSINATPTARAGGGGGGTDGSSAGGAGGSGGGGTGGIAGGPGGSGPQKQTAGTANTGGGGGGSASYMGCYSGNGGSGVVIIRYKFQ